jgi:RNA polymerase sigma-70 factor (ECF subfamily)
MLPEEKQPLEADMALALRGDARAYDRVLRRISRSLQTWLGRRLPPKDCEDVTQDILLSLHRARHTWDGARPLMPWVMAIARFRLQDHWRKHYGHGLEGMADLAAMVDILGKDETGTLETREDVRRGVEGLPERERKILGLMYRQDKSVAEVAGLLGMSVAAVKTAAHRSYKILRNRLKE